MERRKIPSRPHKNSKLLRRQQKPEDVTAELLALKASDEEQYWQSLMTLEFFEIVAMNIRYNSITFEMVYELMGSTICLYWKMLPDHIEKKKESEPDSKNFISNSKLSLLE